MLSTDGERCGYLDVKVPAKSRGKGIKAWKAWRRRWVIVQGMANLTTGRQLVTIDLHSQLQDHPRHHQHRLQQRTTVCLEGAVSVRRVASKSHPYAFAVQAVGQRRRSIEADDDDEIDDDYASIHLSGYSETDSQTWIRALRCILRNAETSAPPSPLRASNGDVFEASLIECLSDYGRQRLSAGPVGYLVILPSVLLLAALEDGCILAELPSSSLERVALVQTVPQLEDKDKIVVIHVSPSSVSTACRLRFYSEHAKEIVSALTNWKAKDPQECQLPMQEEEEETTLKTLEDHEDGQSRMTKEGERATEDEFQTNSGVRCRRMSLFGRNRKANDPKTSGQKMSKTAKSTMLNSRLSRSDTELCSVTATAPEFLCLRDSADGRPELIVTGCEESKDTECIDELSSTPKVAAIEMVLPAAPSILKSLDVNADQRPLSQVSNDSGVMMMNAADEATAAASATKVTMRRPNLPLPQKPRLTIHQERQSRRQTDDADGPMYRKFTDFLQSGEMTLYENLPDRLSTSSDSTIYSEIDISGANGDFCQDNLYEDLDKFRKNIHKLLGIPQDVVVPVQAKTPTTTSKDEQLPTTKTPKAKIPPPLPPRRYKSGEIFGSSSTDNVSDVHVRRKDVMKYLGASIDNGGGTLHKKHKNIYQYLGIQTMSVSQPVGLNQLAEQTYDTPRSGARLQSVSSFKDGTLPRKTSAPVVQRKCSRTYVRVPSSVAASSAILLPTSSEASKLTKKKRMTFLRRKISKDGFSSGDNRPKSSSSRKSTTSINSGCTYVSYDIYRPEEWKTIATTMPFSSSSSSAVAAATSSQTINQNDNVDGDDDDDDDYESSLPNYIIDEEQDVVHDDEEHYCVPTSRNSNSSDHDHQPMYVNLKALQLEDNVSVVDVASIQVVHEDNYLEMGMSSARTSDASEYMDPLELRRQVVDLLPPPPSPPPRPPPPHPPLRKQSNPLAILESVISCIDELRAIYNKVPEEIPAASTGDESSADSEDQKQIAEVDEEDEVEAEEESMTSTSSDTDTSASNPADDQPSTATDELGLRQRLSSYIDQLFSPENMGIEEEAVSEAAQADDDAALAADEQSKVDEDSDDRVPADIEAANAETELEAIERS